MQPAITVITVCRNTAAVIEDCIKSVIAQNIEGLEYIVIDGASTDGTLDIIQKYRSSISQLVSEPDKSLYDAMNKGLKRAHGRFIHFLNADDRYFAADTLKTLLPKMNENTAYFGQLVYRDKNGGERRLGAPFSWKKELRASHVPQPAFFAPKKCYDTVGEFDVGYRIAADYDMILRIAEHFPVEYVPQPTTIMHAGGLSYRQMGVSFYESALVSQRHGRSALASWRTYIYRMAKWQVARRLPPSWLAAFRRACGYA